MTGDLTARWASEEWREEAAAWIGARLAENGLRGTGPIEQPRIRFWSTLLVVPTNAGRVWFKENNPGQAFEAGVVAELADIAPDYVVPPIAVEPERGWLLSLDQGATLADHHEQADEQMWARVVEDFARLQRLAAAHGPRLLAAGLPALPPREAPDVAAAGVAWLEGLRGDDPRRMSADDAELVRTALPRVAARAALLDAGPVPLSLEHNDLHHHNAFAPASDSAPLRFFDFGDALWAHPFMSMAIALNAVTYSWDTDLADRRVRHVVDAYLDAWADLGSRGDLVELLVAALSIAPAHRYVAWRRVLEYADAGGLAEFAAAPRTWLARLAEPDPVFA